MFKKNLIIMILFLISFNVYSEYKPSFMITNDGDTIGYFKLQDTQSEISIKIQCNNIFQNFSVFLNINEAKNTRWNSVLIKKSFDKRTFQEEEWRKVFVDNEFVLMRNYTNFDYIKNILSTEEILIDIPQFNRAFILRYNSKEIVRDYLNIVLNHCNIKNVIDY